MPIWTTAALIGLTAGVVILWHLRRRRRWMILALDDSGHAVEIGEPTFRLEDRGRAVKRLKEKWPEAVRAELGMTWIGVPERHRRTLQLIGQVGDLHLVGDEGTDAAWVMVIPVYYEQRAVEAIRELQRRKW